MIRLYCVLDPSPPAAGLVSAVKHKVPIERLVVGEIWRQDMGKGRLVPNIAPSTSSFRVLCNGLPRPIWQPFAQTIPSVPCVLHKL